MPEAGRGRSVRPPRRPGFKPPSYLYPRQNEMQHRQTRQFVVRDGSITLGQLLKVVDAIGSGGEARGFLSENPVQVNGAREDRRGRKLVPGDRVQLPALTIILVG